ncbi:pentapeptide repeat-containing protein [Leptolyngbya sp. CCNP1308]|uniref:pentapeptide repeat-containing protein n=1 Tax=Leptolyngbya sp. CCNP1308 TaxID=3110255 RepID=UPI002B1FA3C1|nr:pentapeptide repeat-containing protein [Leptolyngbya sp. CCNP1308]MEA5452859.1 pentapeptide repeat-containing protein [Leptolyngbya sp. CCNP1308]
MTNSSNLPPEFERMLSELGIPPEITDALSRGRTPFEAITGRVEDIVRRYQAGERDFRGIQLSGFKILKYINLSGADLREANLSSVDLTSANLRSANLEGANLSDSDLYHANLSGANLNRARLSSARLVQANLAGATLVDSDLKGANLSGCTMPDGTLDPALERIEQAIQHLKCPSWIPVVQQGDSDMNCSKFGGKPWLNADESWPNCPNCGNSMRFFFQVNLQDIPEELNQKFGAGILQFFYCAYETRMEHDHPIPSQTITFGSLGTGNPKYIEHKSCEGDCFDSWPFATNQLVRIVQPSETPAVFEIPETVCELSNSRRGEFPAKLIVDWQRVDDYPDYADIVAQGIDFDDNDSDFMYDSGMYPHRDKLAGWPNWVQDIEYPHCPICQQQMNQLVFQLVSDDNIPYLWGDMGTGYILQCPTHKDQVTFLWQCG